MVASNCLFEFYFDSSLLSTRGWLKWFCLLTYSEGFPGSSRLSRICPQYRRPGFSPWVGKIHWRRESTPVLLPGKAHGQRSLAIYSPWGRKEWDTTERLSTCFLQGHVKFTRSQGLGSNCPIRCFKAKTVFMALQAMGYIHITLKGYLQHST